MSIKGTNPSIVAWALRGLGSSTSGNTPPPQISEAQHQSTPTRLVISAAQRDRIDGDYLPREFSPRVTRIPEATLIATRLADFGYWTRRDTIRVKGFQC